MEAAYHLTRIKTEHSYVQESENIEASSIPPAINVEKVSSFHEFEFVNVKDFGGVAGCLREQMEVETEDLKPKLEMNSMQSSLRDVKPVEEIEEKPKKSGVQRKMKHLESRPDTASNPSPVICATDLRSLNTILKNEVEVLKKKLKRESQLKRDAESELRVIQRQLKRERDEKSTLEQALKARIEEKDVIESELKESKCQLEGKERERLELEVKCSVLSKELDGSVQKYILQSMELAKQTHDLDLIESWQKKVIATQNLIGERLAKLNDEVKNTKSNVINAYTPRLCRLEKPQLELTLDGAKKRKRFYYSEREKLLEKQEEAIRKVGLELEDLNGNVAKLEHDLFVKREQCFFLEDESRVLREELRIIEGCREKDTV